MVDYFLASAVAVITASSAVLGVFLSKYSKLVREADKSARLGKDVWESVNTRFGVVDARIIDLMAKTEVLSSRIGDAQVTAGSQVNSSVPTREFQRDVTSRPITQSEFAGQPRIATSVEQVVSETGTEIRVLQMLLDGPKSSAQIKDSLGRSREHTARLMKGLFDRGLVTRNDRNKPYVYEITVAGKSHMVS